MSADVDADTIAAVVARWQADASLTAALPVARLTSEYTPVKKGEAITYPYADVKVEQSKPAMYQAPVQSGSKYLDFRKVTFQVRQVGKAATGALLALVRDAFAESKTLTAVNGTWKRTLRLDDRVEREKDRRFGEDVHRGTLVLEVWQERTEA